MKKQLSQNHVPANAKQVKTDAFAHRFFARLGCMLFVGVGGAVLSSGCGGSGSASDAPPRPVTPVAPTPQPVNNECEGLNVISFTAANSASTVVNDFRASNLIDGNLSSESRWQSNQSNATVTLDMGQRFLIKELGIAWHEGEQASANFRLLISNDNVDFTTIGQDLSASGETNQLERYNIADSAGQYLRLQTNYTSGSNYAATEVIAFGCALDEPAPARANNFNLSLLNLDANQAPGSNFDLLTWYLDTPEVDPDDGFSTRTSEQELSNGYESEFFYTAQDGGMVFKSPIVGAKTSQNTNYTRSELREMLRRGNIRISTRGVNENNWLLGYQPEVNKAIGGRNGRLHATMAVNRVTTTGQSNQVGRVIIGQIHAEDDEPIRLYYRKFPQNEKGFIYFAHEFKNGDDIYRVVLGSEHASDDSQPNDTSEPVVGIALNEVFSYEIVQDGARIDAFIRRGALDGPIIGHNFVDMSELNSGYDTSDEWMYFKAGAYSQNNSGEDNEYDQVTFYVLENSHD